MPDLELKVRHQDEESAAHAGELKLGGAKLELPGRIPTSGDMRSAKTIKQENFGTKFLIVGKLMSPDTLHLLLNDEEAFQRFASGVASSGRQAPGAARMLYLSYRSGVEMEKGEQLRPFLDLQHLLGFETITVQFGSNPSAESFLTAMDYVKAWKREKGSDTPVLPILPPQDLAIDAGKLLKAVVKRGANAIGVDLQGAFPYHTLRAVEELKRADPDLWVHAFQVAPKVRFAGRRLQTSCGMVLPYFGVDSFNRWFVPPPPVPVKKEKVNVFDRKGWGVMKWAEQRDTWGEKMPCNCPVCQKKDLEVWFADEDRVVLDKSHVHNHFAQADELAKAAETLKEDSYPKVLSSKKFGKPFVEALGEASLKDEE